MSEKKTTTEPNDALLQFFRYEHLPEHLRAVSAPFGVLAMQVCENLPRNPERTVCLRKLLEAKDAAVRTVLYEAPSLHADRVGEQLDALKPIDPRD
jgi:hypothetical protein